MKKSELIKKLNEIEGDFDMLVNGYEGGYEDVDSVTINAYKRDVHKDSEYFGDHELYKDSEIEGIFL